MKIYGRYRFPYKNTWRVGVYYGTTKADGTCNMLLERSRPYQRLGVVWIHPKNMILLDKIKKPVLLRELFKASNSKARIKSAELFANKLAKKLCKRFPSRKAAEVYDIARTAFLAGTNMNEKTSRF